MTPDHTRLTAALRELRTRTGLSLAALAKRTAYSKSSWERYLNGKAMPPRQAVQDLCRVAGEPDGRLLALWEIAESDWSGRAAVLAPAPAAPVSAPAPVPASAPAPAEPRTGPDAGRSHGRWSRLMMMLTSVYAVVAGGVTLTLLLLPHRDAAQDEPLSSSSYALAPRCHGAACEGRDPVHMVCGAAPDDLATYRTATGAHVELRYSKECGASWARMWGTRVGDRVDVTVGGPTWKVRTVDGFDAKTYVYTRMTAARPGSTVRACFRPAAADGERECFGARVGAAVTGRPPA